MAFLDVSALLLDPDMVDFFDVRRKNEVINSHGRSTIVESVFCRQIGVVTAVSPNDLDRQTDFQTATRSISIVTRFKLRPETTNYQPDTIVWMGDNYIVKHVDPYPQFGAGFYQVECSSTDKTDVPFDQPVATGGLVLTNKANSGMVSLCY